MILPALLFTAAALDPSVFDYDRNRPFDEKIAKVERRDGAEICDITYANAKGGRAAAYLVNPHRASGKGPGILFVHWYEPESPDSNRTQFLDEAIGLARSGCTSLLIETMWSDPKWFESRNRNDDYPNSIVQVMELRRALDFLTARKTVDRSRIAYVGHDFGAMYGAVLAGVDKRPHAWALQAGTTSFSVWYLLGTKLQPAERQAVVDQLAPLDPVNHIRGASPAPVLLQFGRSDKYVPESRANEFFAAAKEPKTIQWYEAGHGLNDAAFRDRQVWLRRVLRIK